MEIDKKINSKQVKDMLGGISDVTLSRYVKDPSYADMKFPKPIYINRRRLWSQKEVEQWLAPVLPGKRPK